LDVASSILVCSSFKLNFHFEIRNWMHGLATPIHEISGIWEFPGQCRGVRTMIRTEDSYNLYYDGEVEETQKVMYRQLIEEYQLSSDFFGLLGQEYHFTMRDSYNQHGPLIWLLSKALKTFAISIFFAEIEHPQGCRYQTKVDFMLEEQGHFVYERKNGLLMIDDDKISEECMKRMNLKSVALEDDHKVTSNRVGLSYESFVDMIRGKS
jgi:hypothetical protein